VTNELSQLQTCVITTHRWWTWYSKLGTLRMQTRSQGWKLQDQTQCWNC